MQEWGRRHELAAKRLRNILRTHVVATARILEQKISDAGPTNQRIDPHILTEARSQLERHGTIIQTQVTGVRWYYLASTNPRTISARLAELAPLHSRTQNHNFTQLVGQALEIAVFRALRSQDALHYFGYFSDLDAHDDTTVYSKEEPPSSLSGRRIPQGKKLDFLIQHPQAGYAGIEVKNIREWIYPNRTEIREILLKCCSLAVVPVLIARRIHYSTFSVLNPCGVILHQTFNQLYPNSERELAEQVKNKRLLGYHDIRLGNEPDTRLIRFINQNLPDLLLSARQSFDVFKDLLYEYAIGDHTYKSFAARVKRRLRGDPEDLEEYEDEPPDWYS